MAVHDRYEVAALKGFLFLVGILFAVAATFLLIFFTSAATVTGTAPASAISLVEGANTGILAPGTQRWFRLWAARPPEQAGQISQSLTFIFTPDDGNRIRHVTLQLYDESQIEFFQSNDPSRMNNFGAGQVVFRDNNPETGELFWTGWLWGETNYYVRVMNGSDAPIDYWLFTGDVYAPELGPEPVSTEPAAADLAQNSLPQTAFSLQPGQNRGGLAPGQEAWYSFSTADSFQGSFEPVALTMVTTPDDGNRLRYMTFDVFSADMIHNWSPGDNSQMSNIGAGSIVDRDNNPVTGERVWSGWLPENQTYYVQIRNGADVHMDYWLFPGDIYNPELGQ